MVTLMLIPLTGVATAQEVVRYFPGAASATSAEGTFGSFIPGISPDNAVDSGILLQIVNDPADTGFRTNVGFTNPNLQMVTATVRVFDAETEMSAQRF